MVRLKDGRIVRPGMVIYDVDGAYEIEEIDEGRRCCLVHEVYIDEDGDVSQVGQSWLRTFTEIAACGGGCV